MLVLNRQAEFINSGWARGGTIEKICDNLRSLIQTYPGDYTAIGIDAPRMPLSRPREFYWDKKNNTWRKSRPSDKGYGRHCEVVIKSLGLGNPQWTPLLRDAPQWMLLGFRIFESLAGVKNVFEVFPSASYKMLDKDKSCKVGLNFANFAGGPKDMLDACIAAYTVYEFINGRGSQVGGGDGSGTIVLPGKISHELNNPILTWPLDDKTE
ncbi:hypothetical protein JXQ31_17145 [candidate division KSB1 bacterium]|nr:hypothetical protein [candidate division KSB1 bacterium]